MSCHINGQSKFQNLIIKKEGGASAWSPRPLIAVERPMDMIYEIGGRNSIDTAESSDVHGFHLEVVTKYIF